MTHFTESDDTVSLQLLQLLSDEEIYRQQDLQNHDKQQVREDSYDGNGTSSPILVTFYSSEGSVAVLQNTEFPLSKFSSLLDKI